MVRPVQPLSPHVALWCPDQFTASVSQTYFSCRPGVADAVVTFPAESLHATTRRKTGALSFCNLSAFFLTFVLSSSSNLTTCPFATGMPLSSALLVTPALTVPLQVACT